MKQPKQLNLTPARIIILGFLVIILLGALLLMLPFSTKDGNGAPALTALFTATSATCVTGLVMQDTAQYWSTFGHIVILCLIQIGGMGVVTIAIALSLVSGKRISLKQRWVMQESIAAPQVGGIIAQTQYIIKTALLIELTGALLLMLRFIPQFGLKGIWYGIFHSISAFCNAGFDLMGTEVAFSSLTAYPADPIVNITVSLLIVVGGLGFLVWRNIHDEKLDWKFYTLQTKVVLSVTIALLLFGFLFYYLYEFSLPQWKSLSPAERFWGALFQSATARTAGFNSVDLANMSESGQLIMILLMLVGGSPGSTAGGFKTTTLVVLILGMVAVFRRRKNGQCFGRRIPEEALRSASAIFILYVLVFLTGGILISCIEQLPLLTCLFESASAIATVGLTLGITSQLSTASHLILIIMMYVGRVGGLTMIYAVTTSGQIFGCGMLPQENIPVG